MLVTTSLGSRSIPLHCKRDYPVPAPTWTDVGSSCAMGTRFNSFYHDEMHPFVDAMVGTLSESFARSRRPPMTGFLYRKQDESYKLDIDVMKHTAKQLLDDRRKHPTDKKDLLNAMINNVDSKTGQKLGDDSIINNMITFLIAGKINTSKV